MTNESLTTATPTNKGFSKSTLTWSEATFSWNATKGDWDNITSFVNKSLNTASLTNDVLN